MGFSRRGASPEGGIETANDPVADTAPDSAAGRKAGYGVVLLAGEGTVCSAA